MKEIVFYVQSVPWDSDPRIALVGTVSRNLLMNQSVESGNGRLVVRQSPPVTDMSMEAEESIVRSDYLAMGGEDIEDFMSAALQ